MILCDFCASGEHSRCAVEPHGRAITDENYYRWHVLCDCSCPDAAAARAALRQASTLQRTPR